VPPAPRPQWQQATALITIGAGSIATGLSLVPKAVADLTTPASIPPVTLLALEHANAPAPGRDAMLRAAIVHMARHFLRLAETRSPAEMEAMIWQYASTEGANHGPSCGAFASLTLELGSHIAGVDSWVSGGTSYPWPVHSWVDGRVDPNPASPGVVSILQDARSHRRWHPLADGYAPQPGDWVLFDGHVEVVTKYHGGVLHTIGGDSLPNLSVNAHEYTDPLPDQGVAGFVDNGVGMSKAPGGEARAGGGGRHGARAETKPGSPSAAAPMASADPSPPGGPASAADPVPGGGAAGGAAPGSADSGGPAAGGAASSAGPVTTAEATAQRPEIAPRAIPVPRTVPRSRYTRDSRALPAQGARAAAPGGDAAGAGAATQAARTAVAPQRQNRNRTGKPASHAERSRAMTADVPATGLRPARPHHATRGQAAIPGLFKGAHRHHPGDGGALAPYHRHDMPPSDGPLPGTAAQQAFINKVASGAMDTQRKYGVPASVTIAQAIDESGWGLSVLATNDHNLFGIKGTGPAGSDEQPTQEVINGQLVNLSASFQIYQSIAQSIDAHGRLLARSSDYAGAMAQSKDPNAFAAALTGVYATDPSYGAKLVQLMKQYDLYRFDRATSVDHAPGASGGGAPASHHRSRAAHKTGAKQPGGAQHRGHSPGPPSPGPHWRSPGRDHTPKPQQPGPIGNPVPVQPASNAEPAPGQPAPIANPVPLEPGPMRGSRSLAHDAKPARGTKTGASVAVQRAGTPRSGGAADHAQAVHHDAVTPPPAVLYPGRSARPAPLAHPARPADLARPSGVPPSHDPGASSARTQAQQPGLWPDPAPGTSPSGGGSSADAQRPAAPTAPPANSGPDGAQRPQLPDPAARVSRDGKAGGAIIPGLQHDGLGAHVAAGRSGGATAPDSAGMATARPGGSSIPGAPPGVVAGSASPATGPTDPGAGPTDQGAAHSHPAARSAGPAAAPSHAAAPSAPAPAGGTTHPSTGPASAAPARGAAQRGSTSADQVPAPANPVPPPANPVRAPANPVRAPGNPVPPPGNPVPTAANPMPTAVSTPALGGADVPGLVQAASATAPTVPAGRTTAINGGSAGRAAMPGNSSQTPGGSPAGRPAPSASAGGTLTVYHAHMPPSVRQAFITSAKMPLVRAEPLYRDVASHTGLRWEILAACDWMQCKARHGYSPVYGEKLGALNPDDTCYRTKSAALEQCASDLVQLARSVYQLDIATNQELTVRDLANLFAAYRWGGLLRQHCTSAMDFPYSVAGLTADHTHMRWPNIDEPNAPDKPGSRFRQAFGAVPVVLSLNYQALM
jgi:flagellum-specific peptidoglycan hydrolase FlgJ